MNNSEQVKSLLERSMCYKVVLSTKMEVKCDQSELQRVIDGIAGGDMIKLKQGIINPSFIISIVEDTDRMTEFRRMVLDIDKNNRQDIEYYGGKKQQALPSGIKSLQDIFDKAKLTNNKLLQ